MSVRARLVGVIAMDGTSLAYPGRGAPGSVPAPRWQGLGSLPLTGCVLLTPTSHQSVRCPYRICR